MQSTRQLVPVIPSPRAAWRGVLIVLLVLQICGATAAAEPSDASDSVKIKIKIDGAQDVSLDRQPDGSYRYRLRDSHTTRNLTPDQFADLVYRDHESRSWVEVLFNISSPAGMTWVALGFLGQLLFTGRMLVQWLVSEKKGRSVVPVAFWWLSVGGGVMLLVYFLWRKDIIGVLGQSTGVFIYTRNLILLSRPRKARTNQTETAGPPESKVTDRGDIQIVTTVGSAPVRPGAPIEQRSS